VTASASPSQHSSASRTVGVIVAGIIVAATVFGLFIAAITFAALAIAFPLAIPLVEQYRLPVSASDLALAARFADTWWVFGVLAIASVVAALFVAVKAIAILSPAPRD
jgi:hypothetical protein